MPAASYSLVAACCCVVRQCDAHGVVWLALCGLVLTPWLSHVVIPFWWVGDIKRGVLLALDDVPCPSGQRSFPAGRFCVFQGSSREQQGTIWDRERRSRVYPAESTPEPDKLLRWPINCERVMWVWKGHPAVSWFGLGVASCVVFPKKILARRGSSPPPPPGALFMHFYYESV